MNFTAMTQAVYDIGRRGKTKPPNRRHIYAPVPGSAWLLNYAFIVRRIYVMWKAVRNNKEKFIVICLLALCTFSTSVNSQTGSLTSFDSACDSTSDIRGRACVSAINAFCRNLGLPLEQPSGSTYTI